MKIPLPTLIASFVAVGFLVGCGKDSQPTSSQPPSGQFLPSELSAVFAPVQAGTTVSLIPEIRARARPGDDVTIEAKVMGVMEPFVEGRAVMVVGDEASLMSCDLMGDDEHCSTPWDLCCEDSDLKRIGTATVQVVDENERVLRVDLKGVNGLEELSRLRIQGTVAPNSTPASFILNAKKIEIL